MVMMQILLPIHLEYWLIDNNSDRSTELIPDQVTGRQMPELLRWLAMLTKNYFVELLLLLCVYY
jgi:hypothetical protein